MRRIPPTTIAGLFGLAAFAVAILAGLTSGNSAQSVLTRALLAMLACYPIGLAVGMIALRLVDEHVEAHRSANPSEESSDASDAPAPNVDEHGRPTDEEVLVV